MKKIILLGSFLLFVLLPKSAYAIENPLSVPNNKIGIHVLFDHELKQAATLVNSTNGDWGYVTITIQTGDRDLEKWQIFMNDAKKYHLIPIIRLATDGDYFDNKVWRKPHDSDIVDFANFLNSLDWPVKNRYVIIFNEVNRANEWGGNVNPDEYANLLSYAVTVFKSKSPDFFIMPAGLDNAAPNQPNDYMNEYDFMRQMNEAVPGIYSQIDGLSSHSYPNPGFSMPPQINCFSCINSFQYEKAVASTMTTKNLPVFLSETGWSSDKVSDKQIAGYYLFALNNAWNDPSIVAITPFLLQGSNSPFQQFSFLGPTDTLSQRYLAWKNVAKIKGKPTLANNVLAAETTYSNDEEKTYPMRDFSKVIVENKQITPSKALKTAFKWLLKL
ncbi:MAG TPA: hypothetical protein VLG67_03940 [Candidatus Saccharimonadales bacterium]|nr:hypothetical protein [Candidatus Saccharimonadales bacterium]